MLRYKDFSIKGKLMTFGMTMLILPLIMLAAMSYFLAKREISSSIRRSLIEQAKTHKGVVEIIINDNKEFLLDGAMALRAKIFPGFTDGDSYMTIENGNLVAVGVSGAKQEFKEGDDRFIDYMVKSLGEQYHLAIFQVKEGKGIAVTSSLIDGKKRINGTGLPANVLDAIIKEKGGVTLLVDTIGGRYLAYYEPLFDKDKVTLRGVLFSGFSMRKIIEDIKEEVSPIAVGNSGFIFLMDKAGTFIVHPKLAGQNLEQFQFVKDMIAQKNGYIRYNIDNTDKVAGFAYYVDFDWIIGSCAPAAEFEVILVNIRNAALGTLIGLIIIGIVLISKFSKTFSRPLILSSQILNQVAAGDFTYRAEDTGLSINQKLKTTLDGKDEISVILRGVDKTTTNLRKIIRSALNNACTVSATSEMIVNVTKSMMTLAEQVNSRSQSCAQGAEQASTNVKTVAAAVDEIGSNATTVASSAEEIYYNLNTMAAACEELSNNMNAVSSSTEQTATMADLVAATIKAMSLSLTEVSNKSSLAVKVATGATQKADQTSTTVHNLGKSASEVGKVIDSIKNIASRTNLLALNASIEAASAGEAGKGFAVVANEVKELARQTTKASEEISDQVHGMQSDTAHVVKAIAEIIAVIGEMNTIFADIAISMKEQTSQTSNIAHSAAEMAGGAGEISKHIQQSALNSTEISKAVIDAVEGVNSITRNVTTLATGVTAVAKNANEAALGIATVAHDVGEMKQASEHSMIASIEATSATTELDAISKALHEQMNAFLIGKEKFPIGNIKSDHLIWRARIEPLIAGYKNDTHGDGSTTKECLLGGWYLGEGQSLVSFKEFAEVGRHHERIHMLAGELITLIERGDRNAVNSKCAQLDECKKDLFETLDKLYLA